MSARINRLTEKLKVKDFKLTAMLEITRAINANVPTDELLHLYKSTLRDRLGIEKLILFTKDDSWKCLLQFGVDGEVVDITDEAFFDQSSNISLSATGSGEDESFDIVIPVYHDAQPLAYLLVGDIGEDKIRVSPVIKHMNFIQTITNVIIVAIQNKQLAEEKIVQERLNRELELAAEMQAILIPNKLPSNSRFEIAAIYKPHQQVGGDYYDFIELHDEEVIVCMADVSGKGVSAAFLMANFQAYLQALFTYENLPLEEVITELNEKVMSSAMGEKYITFFIAKCNLATAKMSYINCGHNPPIICREDGSSEILELGSIGLGMFEELPMINRGEVDLKPNDILVCYTDGLVEQENVNKVEFGLDKLEELILGKFNSKMEDLNETIMSELEKFRGQTPRADDTALLSCRFF
jgi:sigma-B regulation protein RsbU (phosphoserine phosphatase)